MKSGWVMPSNRLNIIAAIGLRVPPGELRRFVATQYLGLQSLGLVCAFLGLSFGQRCGAAVDTVYLSQSNPSRWQVSWLYH